MNEKKRRYKILRNERGFATIYMALAAVAIFAAAALSVDVGKLVAEKAHLQKCADAAALAGAQKLPEDSGAAYSLANAYLLANNGGEQPGTVEITFPEAGKIRVTAARTVPFSFAPVIGKQNSTVTAHAVAVIGVAGGMNGIIPIAIEDMGEAFAIGETMELKEGPGDGYDGNYKAVSLGGTGADVYKDNLHDGYDGIIHIGQTVDTEPGVMVGPTKKGVNDRLSGCSCTAPDYAEDCPCLVYLPIVEAGSFGDINGKDTLTVVGFAAFHLDDIKGNGILTGTFVKRLTEAEIDAMAKDFGLRVVKLVE